MSNINIKIGESNKNKEKENIGEKLFFFFIFIGIISLSFSMLLILILKGFSLYKGIENSDLSSEKQSFYKIYTKNKDEKELLVDNEEIKNKIYSLYKTELKYIPDMSYGQYIEKIKSGDFVSQQNVYDPIKNNMVKVFSDQYGQHYAINHIKNNENNSAVSPYYENITYFDTIKKPNKSLQDKSKKIYSYWYEENKNGLRQFIGEENVNQIKLADCDCNDKVDYKDISNYEFFSDLSNFIKSNYTEKLN